MITRSAAYAVVTVVVGTVWAASSDLVKLVITELMGRESEAGATTMGAIIAAGNFFRRRSRLCSVGPVNVSADPWIRFETRPND